MNSFGHIFSQSSQKNVSFFLSLYIFLGCKMEFNLLHLIISSFAMSIHCVVFSERVKKNDVRRMCVCVFFFLCTWTYRKETCSLPLYRKMKIHIQDARNDSSKWHNFRIYLCIELWVYSMVNEKCQSTQCPCFPLFQYFNVFTDKQNVFIEIPSNQQHQQKLDSIECDNIKCVGKLGLIDSTMAKAITTDSRVFFRFHNTTSFWSNHTQSHSDIESTSFDHKTCKKLQINFWSMTHSTFVSVILACLQLCRVYSYTLVMHTAHRHL